MARSHSAKAPTIDHLHHHATRWRRGVDRLGDRAEAGADLVDSLHDMEHVFQRPRQTVELPDDDNIAFAQLVEHAVQLGPVPAPAGGGFLEYAAAAAGAEGLGLHGIALLVAFGDAGVAEQHAVAGFHKRAFANGTGSHGSSW